jgi:MoxR-like ATPase
MNITFDPDLSKTYELAAIDSWPATYHQFDVRSVWAVRAALAAQRPLLVRGEPGIGKSQLARAAAHILGVPFLYQVINARSECGDLLCIYDAVSRLAQAQVVGAAGPSSDWEAKLDEARFVRPGILWWAFDWESARRQAEKYCRVCPEPAWPQGWSAGKGCVVLIDEIDKADADVPNGLLESLGNLGFQAPQADCSVALPPKAIPPLVVVTTNEERELPAAFLRRCLVLSMKLPEEENEQADFLTARAHVHFGDRIGGEEVYRKAAEQLYKDRKAAQGISQVRPGPAKYLDLLRALAELHPGEKKRRLDALAEIQEFALRKNPEGPIG